MPSVRSSTPDVSDPVITKPLFEAGSQCPKRLYLDFHRPEIAPEPSEHRQELAEIGEHLVEVASKAFPKGLSLADLAIDDAVESTRELIAQKKPGVVFHAAFRGGGAEVLVDITLTSTKDEVDIFEVKAGTTVKQRHVLDVALQIHTIESTGVKVRSASILHLDPKFQHDGGKEYPAQKLFKSVDVTERARRQVDKVRERIESFEGMLEDEATLELPTGTWCNVPLPCPHLAKCRAEGPEFPLLDLPQLKHDLESRLHEQGIEDIASVDVRQAGLTVLQRRVVRSVHERALVVEPFVPAELHDIDFPLAFVHVHWHLQVLPLFAGSKPWQKIPFLWSVRTLDEVGKTTHRTFCATQADDQRAACLNGLADALRSTGTVLVFGRGLDERLRAMLDDLPEVKSDLRALLQLPLFELGNLVHHGVYHPGFAGRYDLHTIARVLCDVAAGTDDVADDEVACQMYRRIIKSRTRQATRDQLGQQLVEYAARQSEALMTLFEKLRDASASSATSELVPPGAEPETGASGSDDEVGPTEAEADADAEDEAPPRPVRKPRTKAPAAGKGKKAKRT